MHLAKPRPPLASIIKVQTIQAAQGQEEIILARETPSYQKAIESLTAQAFGPGRYSRSAHLLRQDIGHDPLLSFIILGRNGLLASLRMNAIKIAKQRGALLGPLVVTSDYQNYGLGKQLMHTAQQEAHKRQVPFLLLIGNAAYYQRFGFSQVPNGQIRLPAPADPTRVLAYEIIPETLAKSHGLVRPGW